MRNKLLGIVILLHFFSLNTLAQNNEKKKDVKKDSTSTTDDKLSYQKLLDEGGVKKGLFNVYRLKKDLFFEINDSLLGKDLLIVNKISKVPYELNSHGLNKGMAYETKVVRFYKDTLLNKVWVKTINPRVQSPKNDAITLSVKDNFGESIIEAFDIESQNIDTTSVVIKVNKVFNGEEKSFSDFTGNTGLSIATSVKTKLSKIEEVKTFPNNTVVKTLLSMSASEGGPSVPLSVGITTNIVLLPTDVMQPRFEDARIGYFSTPMDYYSDKQHEVEHRKLITRWRLEPKDKDIKKYKKGILVEPKKQIVYYIDPSTPKQWQPYIEQGVYDWNKAFEKAGFKNVLVVKYVSEKDKDFDIDDIRYSVITYVASEQINAMGPSIYDPRSGEILEADIIWWHNLMKGLHSWMRVQTGPIDKNARFNQFSEELMGESIRFASSHEVGHTFGLKHNMGSSFSFPVDSLRSPTFTAKMHGTATSIMDYARYNYVAQPGDNVTEIKPQIGVYDLYAIDWGYRWLDVKDAHEELATLSKWIRKHENDPFYFYGPQQSYKNTIDPRSQSEDLGDDAVKASEYGLKNLKRIIPNILEWTEQEGDDYYKASKLYKSVVDQWQMYNDHVMANIGGLYVNNTVYGDSKNTYTPVPVDIQKRALDYIINNAILPQKWLFTPNIINNVQYVKDAPDGPHYYSPVSLFRGYQAGVLHNLLESNRLMRIAEYSVLSSKNQELFSEEYLFDELYSAIFSKTLKGKTLNIFDRLIQKNYVDVLTYSRNNLLKKTKTSRSIREDEFKNVYFSTIPRVSDEGSYKRGELERILKLLEKKKSKGDRATKDHYNDLIARIMYNLKS